jgi:hypothetical protein
MSWNRTYNAGVKKKNTVTKKSKLSLKRILLIQAGVFQSQVSKGSGGLTITNETTQNSLVSSRRFYKKVSKTVD